MYVHFNHAIFFEVFPVLDVPRVAAIRELWTSPVFRNAWDKRAQVMSSVDTAGYFLDNLEKVRILHSKIAPCLDVIVYR